MTIGEPLYKGMDQHGSVSVFEGEDCFVYGRSGNTIIATEKDVINIKTEEYDWMNYLLQIRKNMQEDIKINSNKKSDLTSHK